MKRITFLVLIFLQAYIFYRPSIAFTQPIGDIVAFFPMYNGIQDVVGGHPVNIKGGNIQLTEDRFGTKDCAVKFFSKGYGEVENGYNFSPGGVGENYSYSLWFKTDISEDEFGNFISKSIVNSIYTDISIYWNFGLGCNQNNGYVEYTTFEGFIENYEWRHLVIVKEGLNLLLYLDNQLVDIGYLEELGEKSEGKLFIGKEFSGSLDDILFYNRALSENEVLELFNSPGFCIEIDSLNYSLVEGTLFNDLNRNNIKDANEQFLNNFNLLFSPTNASVNTNSNGGFQTILDKNQIHSLNLSPDSNAVWTFTQPQNPIDLSNYPDYIYNLGLIGVHKRPKKEVLLSGTLFSDENGNNVFDGIDTLLPDYNLELAPSNIILTSNSIGYFGYSLDSGDVQTLNIPISE